MDSDDLQIPQLSHFSHKNKSSYVEAAKEIREFGKNSKLGDTSLRREIACALEKASGVTFASITTPPKDGGDKTLYPLWSVFTGVARPKGKTEIERRRKEQMLDAELQNPETTWQRIVDASRGTLFGKDIVQKLKKSGHLK